MIEKMVQTGSQHQMDAAGRGGIKKGIISVKNRRFVKTR